MDRERQEQVFDRYCGLYKDVFRFIYPSKGSTGFAERNLSVNFSKAYEAAAADGGEKAVSWFEFQFGPRNNRHVDAVILNDTAGELLIVESKRFSNPNQKVGEIVEDIGRMDELIAELRAENQRGTLRIDLSKVRRCYGIILADAWPEGKYKTGIIESYQAGVRDPASPDSFLHRYCGETMEGRTFPGLSYDLRTPAESWNNRYYLTSFVWRMF